MLVGSSIMLEPLLAALELGAIAAALHARRRSGSLRWPVITGLIIGVAALTREIGLLLLPTACLLVWGPKPRLSRRSLAAPLAIVAAAAVVVLPWTARNAKEFGRFIPVTTASGLSLAGTYNQTSYDSKGPVAPWIPAQVDPAIQRAIARHPGLDEAEFDAVLRKEGLKFMADHPGYVVKASVWNFARLFDLDGGDQSRSVAKFIPYRPGLLRIAMHASWLLWAAAVVSLAMPRVRRRLPWQLAIFPLLAITTFAVMSGNIRYRASIEPMAVVLAAALIGTAASSRAPKSMRSSG
jgi:4-amino-4-deoxy-L-arabinose transferase-like glycosyltransferase